MSKLSPAFFLLPLLFLATGTRVASIGSDICREGLGLCGQDCDARCKTKHAGENPQGTGDSSITPTLCTCLYSCGPPPEPKICQAGLGECSIAGCGKDCCNAKCATQFNKGQGSCNSVAGGLLLCQCFYPC